MILKNKNKIQAQYGRALLAVILGTTINICAQIVQPQQTTPIVMPGPGIAKHNFQTDELFKFFVDSSSEHKDMLGLRSHEQGPNTAATEMLNGYVIVPTEDYHEIWDGGYLFYDASQLPKAMPLVKRVQASVKVRESNVINFRRDADGKIYAVTMVADGLLFFDWTDAPRTSKEIAHLVLPNTPGIPYEAPWWVTWQGRYIYAGGVGAGLFIIDAEDPANPKIVKIVPNSEVGRFRASMCIAVGNLLYLGEEDEGNGQSTMDISDPLNPKLIALHLHVDDSLAQTYSSFVNGNLMIVAGRSEGLNIFDLSDDTKIKLIGRIPGVDGPVFGKENGQANGLAYLRFQDGFVHGGSNGFAHGLNNYNGAGYWKFDIRDPSHPKIVKHIESGGYHYDWGVPVGNFAFISDDMTFGSGVIAHTELADVIAPKVNMVVPRSGRLNQAVTSRVGVTFTDEIAAETVTPENFYLVAVGSNTPVEGYWGIQQAEAQFSPKAPLQPNTEYKIIVRKGGIKDYAGNPTDEAFESHFTTGTSGGLVQTPVPAGSITAVASSEHSGSTAAMAIDGNENTYWETQADPKAKLPQDITLTFDKVYNLGTITYIPRRDTQIGNITRFELWISANGTDYTKQTEGFWFNDTTTKVIRLDAIKAKAIRLNALAGDRDIAQAAEIKVTYLDPSVISTGTRPSLTQKLMDKNLLFSRPGKNQPYNALGRNVNTLSKKHISKTK